jgi:general L-amino acid transport system substrate-binding protein
MHKAAAGLLALGLALHLVGVAPATASTLDDVRERGHVVCGLGEEASGFSRLSDDGVWTGQGADFCAALAAAVLGDKTAIKFRALAATDRYQALASGDVDVLAQGTPWTLSRDTELGIKFAGVLFYDGQGFLVRRGHGVTGVLELSGATICVLEGTSAARGLADFFRRRQMRYQTVVAKSWGELVKAYVDGRCTLLTGDKSLLAFEGRRLAEPQDHMLLPELITKEPLGPAVRQGDEQWFAIVRWTVNALIAAEELGLTQENIDGFQTSTLQDVRRFLGLDGDLGRAMGLKQGWAYNIVKQVGNFGEIYDRNFGPSSTLKLDRGLNNLSIKGGLMYALPIR